MEKIEAEKPAKEDVDMVEVAAATSAPEEGGEETTAVETDAVAIAVSEVQSPPSESPATKDKEPAESVKDEQDSTETTTAAENTKAGEAPKTTAEVSEDAENEKTETQVAVVACERTTLLTVCSSGSSPHCLVVPQPYSQLLVVIVFNCSRKRSSWLSLTA